MRKSIQLDFNPIYSIGDRLYSPYYMGEYIIAQVAPLQVALVSLRNGNRIAGPVFVEDPYMITAQELEANGMHYFEIKNLNLNKYPL